MGSCRENFLWLTARAFCVRPGGLAINARAALTSKEERGSFSVAGPVDTSSTPGGTAPAAPTGEAPTYVNTQRFPPQASSSAESSPRKDLFDMSAFPFASVFFPFEVAFHLYWKSVQLLNFLRAGFAALFRL